MLLPRYRSPKQQHTLTLFYLHTPSYVESALVRTLVGAKCMVISKFEDTNARVVDVENVSSKVPSMITLIYFPK